MKKIFTIGEWLLLALVTFISLSPFYISEWFHTGDGPFHIYSATVLGDFLFHSGETFGRFFDLHYTPVPNTSVLFFQAFMLEFFSPNKVVMLTIILISISMIGSYLYFIKSVNPEHKGISLLILPVIINFFTIMGFFSFLASLALMFFTIGYFHRNAALINWKQTAVMVCLITLNWFTHFTGALFSLSYIFLYIILMGRGGLGKIGTLLYISFPFVLLSLIFGKDATKANILHFQTLSEHLKQFRETAPIICYHSDEIQFMKYFQYFILMVFPISFYYFFKRKTITISFAPLIYCLLLIIAFFTVPSDCLSVKFISIRILFCALLFFCAFIEMYSPRYLLILTIPVSLFILLKKNNYQTPIVETYSNAIERIIKNSALLPEGKAVVAMNYSNNWLEYNICLYPATVYKTVILDNEEASTFNSVIRWRKEKKPGQNIGNVLSSNTPTLKLDYEKDANEKIEGILRWQYNSAVPNPSKTNNDSIITKLFKPMNSVDGIEIFLRK